MKYYGKITHAKDLVTKEYVDEHGGGTYTAGEGIVIDDNEISVNSTVRTGAAAGATALQHSDVVDNVTTQTADVPLSANQGRVLNSRIDNLSTIGRFLAIWNATTGSPTSDPATLPYTYHTGDYYRVGAVDKADQYLPYDEEETYNQGDKCSYNEAYYICNTDGTTGEWDATKWTAHTITNYKPDGSQYTGLPSTATYTDPLAIGDVFYYDGSVWMIQAAGSGGTVQDVQINGTSILNSGIANIPVANGTSLGAIKSITINNGSNIIDANGTANLPIITSADFGLAKVNPAGGTNQAGGLLYLEKATEQELINKTVNAKPVVPLTLDIAIREGLGNNALTWTDQYQTSARTTIGAAGTSDLPNVVRL